MRTFDNIWKYATWKQDFLYMFLMIGYDQNLLLFSLHQDWNSVYILYFGFDKFKPNLSQLWLNEWHILSVTMCMKYHLEIP